MPEKYHINVVKTPPRFHQVGKYSPVQFLEECAGSCRDCVKKNCVYGVHNAASQHISSMREPEYLYDCYGCLRCVQECVKGTFSLTANPEFKTMGNDYWRPEIIRNTWFEAETGQVPVSGAGYRGPFTGEGFDAMWTDMSEIVRPTRDGIHGREYISTSVELSRRPMRLEFNDMSLVSKLPPILEVPIPVLFQLDGIRPVGDSVLHVAARAAKTLNTMMYVQPGYYADVLKPYADNLVPCLTRKNYQDHIELIRRSRMVELAYEPGIDTVLTELRSFKPDLLISVGLRLNNEAVARALEMARSGVDVLHFTASPEGRELDELEPRFIKDAIRELHNKFVANAIRSQVNMVFSGGIALAEHVAKAIICGADAVTVDYPLLIALECRMCQQCQEGKPCPVKLEEVDLNWGTQRVINLMSSWRNQLLEVLGAMGIREVRRLRGEVGRSMGFEDLEREIFGTIFGEKKVPGNGVNHE